MIRILNLTARDTSIGGGYGPGDIVVCLCDATDGAFTVTLPDARTADNSIFFVLKTDSSANAITVATVESQTISGATTASISARYHCRAAASSKSNWFWIAAYGAVPL